MLDHPEFAWLLGIVIAFFGSILGVQLWSVLTLKDKFTAILRESVAQCQAGEAERIKDIYRRIDDVSQSCKNNDATTTLIHEELIELKARFEALNLTVMNGGGHHNGH